MEKPTFSQICCPSSAAGGSRKRSELLNIIRNASCLNSSSKDTGKGRSKSSSNRVRHGFHLVEGKSGHDMEDYLVAEYRYDRNHELGIFAVFDGHLGDSVPSYLKDNLFNNILKESTFWVDPEGAIKNAYRSTNKFILENTRQLGPGGSTAVTAIVVDGTDLWIANIGDSRAVLCERGAANQITVDHEPHVERQRIEKQGGFVTAFPGDVPRVNGQLAVARAFGDQSLKAHLSSEPDVRHIPLDSTMDFVILASDGLWKVIQKPFPIVAAVAAALAHPPSPPLSPPPRPHCRRHHCGPDRRRRGPHRHRRGPHCRRRRLGREKDTNAASRHCYQLH